MDIYFLLGFPDGFLHSTKTAIDVIMKSQRLNCISLNVVHVKCSSDEWDEKSQTYRHTKSEENAYAF